MGRHISVRQRVFLINAASCAVETDDVAPDNTHL